MKPVRVLHVVPNMHAGGLETFIMNVYRNISRDQVQFDFLVHYEKHCFYDDEIEALGGRIYRLTVREDHKPFKYLKNLIVFFKEHREYRMIHGHMASTGVFYFLVAGLYGAHTRICHSHSASMERTLKGLVKRIISKPVKRFANVLFACSGKAGRFLFGRKCFAVIPNAIDVERFSFSQAVRERVRNELFLSDKFVVGHVGRFEGEKNHVFLLEIFCEIKKMRPDAALLLIGTGSRLAEIRIRAEKLGISDSVCFLGVRSDVHALYQAMDVFVLPSFYEGIPIVLIEAQYAGLPVFVSDAVSAEANISERYYPLSLHQNAKAWAAAITGLPAACRDQLCVSNAGYDIKEVAQGLQAFYLKRHAGDRR